MEQNIVVLNYYCTPMAMSADVILWNINEKTYDANLKFN